MSVKRLLNSIEIDDIISDLAKKIIKDVRDVDHFAIVGVQGGGVELASRLRERIESYSNKKVKHGIIDITFYRDDIATRGVLPVIKETRIDFNITKMTILLVDDVIFTGRTTKAALETLMSFGRPSMIKLFCMVDRGNRELPIQPDYCGYHVETDVADKVRVILSVDDTVEDEVILERDV